MSSIFDMYVEEAYGITSDYSLDDLFVESTVFVTESVKDIINRIKESLVRMIDRVNGWLAKKPDSKIKTALTSLLNKIKSALTKTKNFKEGDDIKEVQKSYDEVNQEYNVMKVKIKTYKNIPGFEPSNFLLKTLKDEPRDIYDIVGALMGYINADPKWKTDDFTKALLYVKLNGVPDSELYQKFDSSDDIEEDKSKWDEDYYAMARVHLKKNFCRVRIAHCKEVAKYLYG